MGGMQQLSRRFKKRLRDPRRRGVIIVLAAFLIQAMFAFAAFAVDLGFIVLTSQQLQNAADAAALASVLELKSADPTLTPAQIRQNAINEAVRAASYNKAALRDVKIDERDILFGNRHFDETADKWVNTYETDSGFGNLPINSVDVRISYDGDSGTPLNNSKPSGSWPVRTGREKLGLFFGRVIQVNETIVSGDSRAHLTPRDLAFILDISGSMSDDTTKSGTTRADYAKALFPFYGSTLPADKNYTGQSTATASLSLPLPTSTKTNKPVEYAEFNRSGTTANPVYTPNILWYKWLWGRTWQTNVWGTTAQRKTFADREFWVATTTAAADIPNFGPQQYWTHWKWRAYCDYCWHNNTANGKENDGYNGFSIALNTPDGWDDNKTGIGSGNGLTQYQPLTTITFTKNPNIITSAVSTSSGYERGNFRMGVQNYANFLLLQGMSGPIGGIQYIPRDANLDGNLDTLPPAGFNNPLYPYPSFAGFYPKPMELPGYDHTLLGEGPSFHGVYPGDTMVKPNCYVRQATLFGINAMISDENAGNDAYDQVGMITYGTLAHRDLELTNDLGTALKIANCRVSQAGSNLNILPTGNGNTNIGMSIRQGIQMLKYSARTRSYTNKTMALLTDGVPNISPTSGNTANEFNAAGTQTITNNDAKGQAYANYWADEAKDEGIVIHTIVVGDGANEAFLEGIATKTGGVSFVVTNPEQDSQALNNIFIAIGKDKIGKLFGDQ